MYFKDNNSKDNSQINLKTKKSKPNKEATEIVEVLDDDKDTTKEPPKFTPMIDVLKNTDRIIK